MNRKITALLLCACCILCLAGCADVPDEHAQTEQTPLEQNEGTVPESPSIPQGDAAGTTEPEPPVVTEPEPPAATEPEPPAATAPDAPATDGDICRLYAEAIVALEPSVTLNVTGRKWKYGAENDLKNFYYTVLSQQPELKYAYDMTASVSGNWAECSFSYMPYKTGTYSEGVPAGSHTVGSLHDADAMAQSMIDGTARLPIAITDPALDVDDLQRAVGQAGYGWISFSLSRDGTEITALPVQGMTLEDCVQSINESFRIAGEILEEIVTEDMTDMEKVAAAYGYITGNVSYDFRYYSGKNDMPYESTVALGALRDGLAICGGYSHALETLLDMCGIENYTVSGVCKDEYHAWNYVVLDGQGYYCDPTADRGGMSNHFLLTEEELVAAGGYEWDTKFCSSLHR